METKKIKKKRFNVARTLVFVLFIYLVVCLCMYVYKEPVRHYKITGNDIVSDIDIIRTLKLEDYPSFISINCKSLEKELLKNKFINSVDISYGWNFSLNIKVEENIPVYILKSTNEVVLSDNSRIENTGEFIGLPILLNSTPENAMKVLSKELGTVEVGIRYLISEIEYNPSYDEKGNVIDSERFLLAMNDKNMVYITAKLTNKLNNYLDFISNQKVTSRGTLFLDGDEGRYTFKFATDVNSEEDKIEEEQDGEVNEE